MESATQLLEAAAGLIWPLLVVVLVWRLYPTISQLIAARGFTVKFGQFEFTAQEATDQLLKSTAELQSQVAALGSKIDEPAAPSAPPQGLDEPEREEPVAKPVPRNILWVDDDLTRKAYEIAQLEALGVRVTPATSTREALEQIDSRDFDAVVSSMGRSEEGSYQPMAGLKLVRDSDSDTPVYIFASNLTSALTDEVEAAAGDGVATNSTQLFQLLGAHPSSATVAAKTTIGK